MERHGAVMAARQLYLILIFTTVLLSPGVAWVIVKISRSWNWNPLRTQSALGVTWILYELWVREAVVAVSGFHPHGRLVWLGFAVQTSAVALTVVLGTKWAFGEVLWTAADHEPTLLRLGLDRPEDLRRNDRDM